MAILTLNEVRVSKHVGDNGAFQVEELEDVNGQTWTKRYTVWNKTEAAPEVDTYVTVTGKHGAKAREYTDLNGDTKTAVDVSINEPVWKNIPSAGIPTSLLENEITDSDTPF